MRISPLVHNKNVIAVKWYIYRTVSPNLEETRLFIHKMPILKLLEFFIFTYIQLLM